MMRIKIRRYEGARVYIMVEDMEEVPVVRRRWTRKTYSFRSNNEKAGSEIVTRPS